MKRAVLDALRLTPLACALEARRGRRRADARRGRSSLSAAPSARGPRSPTTARRPTSCGSTTRSTGSSTRCSRSVTSPPCSSRPAAQLGGDEVNAARTDVDGGDRRVPRRHRRHRRRRVRPGSPDDVRRADDALGGPGLRAQRGHLGEPHRGRHPRHLHRHDREALRAGDLRPGRHELADGRRPARARRHLPRQGARQPGPRRARRDRHHRRVHHRQAAGLHGHPRAAAGRRSTRSRSDASDEQRTLYANAVQGVAVSQVQTDQTAAVEQATADRIDDRPGRRRSPPPPRS